MASTLFSSQNSSTTATATAAAAAAAGRREEGRCSSSSYGVYSPVDIRSAGRGATGGSLGLGSPPSGVLLFHEERDDYSPPRPRAFWREKWHRECSCGGGRGENCGTLQCRRRALSESDRGVGGGGVTHQCLGKDCPSSDARGSPSVAAALCEGGRVRHAAVEGAQERRVGVTHYRRCCGNSSAFRDRRGVASDISNREDIINREENSSVVAAQPDLLTSASSSGGVRESELERDIPRKDSQEERPECARDGNGGDTSRDRGGVSAAGLSLLAVVAIAAFATGTMVGPPHRRHPAPAPPPPLPPLASPVETSSPLPSPSTYEPTLQEMARAKAKKRKEKKKTKSPAATTDADEIEQTQTIAMPEGSGVVGRDRDCPESSETGATTATGARASTVIASGKGDLVGDTQQQRNGSGAANGIVVGQLVPECEGDDGVGLDGVAAAAATADPGGNISHFPHCRGQQEAKVEAVGGGMDRQETTEGAPFTVAGDGGNGEGRSVSQAAATESSSAASNIRSRGRLSSSRTVRSVRVKPSMPLTLPSDASQSSSSASGNTAATSSAAIAAPGPATGGTPITNEKTRRGRRRQPGRSPAFFGSTPAAFARTLGSAESILALFSDSGNDEQAGRATAIRAAMSEKAARSACKTLAWSKAGSAAMGGGRRGNNGDCDTDAAWKGFQGGGVLGAAPLLSAEEGVSSGHGNAAGREAELAADTAPEAASTIEETRPEVEEESLPKRSDSGGSGNGRSKSSCVGASPAAVPRCRELVLSGKDVHASWAGRYTLAKADSENEDNDHKCDVMDPPASEADDVSPTPHVKAPCYCRDTSLPAAPNAAAGVARDQACLSREEEIDRREEGPRTCPRHALFSDEERCPAGAGAISEHRSEKVLAAAVVRPDPGFLEATATSAAATTAAAETDAGNWPLFPGAPATETAVSATPYPPEADSLGLSEAAEGGVLCFYWADLGNNGGRWVLDDDLSLSNGVLAVTKGPAPAAADLAFVNRERCRQGSRTWGSEMEGDRSNASGGCSGRGDTVVEAERNCARDGVDANWMGDGDRGEGVALSRRRGGAVDGLADEAGGTGGDGVDNDESGGAAAVDRPVSSLSIRRSAVVSEAEVHPTWLLDSPRVQGWVETDEMVVLCVTD